MFQNLKSLLVAFLFGPAVLLWTTTCCRACSYATFSQAQVTYGPQVSLSVDGYGSEFIVNNGVAVAQVQLIGNVETLVALNGVYASQGTAVIAGGPLNPNLVAINAGFYQQRAFFRTGGFRGEVPTLLPASAGVFEGRGFRGGFNSTSVVAAPGGAAVAVNVENRGLFGRRQSVNVVAAGPNGATVVSTRGHR